jgi:hypothetical protein
MPYAGDQYSIVFVFPEAVDGLLALDAGFRPSEHVAIQLQSTFRTSCVTRWWPPVDSKIQAGS